MAEKKRGALTQRIGMGVFLGILGLGVGLGVYEGFDEKKEKTPVVRDVEVTDKTVHNKDKNDPPSTLVEAVHKDKSGRVLIRVLGKDKEEAERLLQKEIDKSAERERETDMLYQEEVKKARESSGTYAVYSEKKTYSLLEKEVSRLFSVRFGTSKSDMKQMFEDYDRYEDGLTFTKVIGTLELKTTLTLNREDKIEGYSMRISSEDVSMLRSSSNRLRVLLSAMTHGDREYVSVGVRGLDEKKAYTLVKTGR